VVRADDSSFTEGRGCYTSIRIRGGEPRFIARHLRRLHDGAAALGLGLVDDGAVHRAISDLVAAAFPDGEGAVRLQLSADGDGATHLVGLPRGLGEDHPTWTAVSAPQPHPGAVLTGGPKLTNRLALALAAASAREAGVDEALLFDAGKYLVEGSRSNVVVVTKDGETVTPPESLGAVAGIALQIALERVPEIGRRTLSRPEVDGARELIALNSVRGARPIVALDGCSVGDGSAGPFGERLREVLDRE
jgi:branched-subunit amino acid aminotransferase/4-amino-4-deoxychorismate lyase